MHGRFFGVSFFTFFKTKPQSISFLVFIANLSLSLSLCYNLFVETKMLGGYLCLCVWFVLGQRTMAASESSGSQTRELDQTPTWAVSGVCAVIIIVSIVLEKVLHKLGIVSMFLFSPLTSALLIVCLQIFHLFLLLTLNYSITFGGDLF